MMSYVRQEIVDNEKQFAQMSDAFAKIRTACNVLTNTGWETLPEDSLQRFVQYVNFASSFNIKRTAWDIFQNSDIISNFGDKELIMMISDLYNLTDILNKANEKYIDDNTSAMKTPVGNFSSSREYINALLKNEASKQFMASLTYGNYAFEAVIAQFNDVADFALYKIDKSGNYDSKYNNINEEFQKFLENGNITHN